MSVLGRLKDWNVGGSILSQDFDDEFNQIINLLNGTSTNKEIILKASNLSLPILEINNLGTGRIFAINEAAGVRKLRILNNGQINSDSLSVPLIINNQVLCPNLNADLFNNQQASFYEQGLSAFNTWQVFYSDLTAASNPKKGYFICPDGQTITITKLKAQQRKATASGDASTVIEFRKNDVSIGTVTISSNNTAVVTNDIVDVTLAENDRLSVNINSHVGTTKHEDITVVFHFKKLFNNLN